MAKRRFKKKNKQAIFTLPNLKKLPKSYSKQDGVMQPKGGHRQSPEMSPHIHGLSIFNKAT